MELGGCEMPVFFPDKSQNRNPLWGRSKPEASQQAVHTRRRPLAPVRLPVLSLVLLSPASSVLCL